MYIKYIPAHEYTGVHKVHKYTGVHEVVPWSVWLVIDERMAAVTQVYG